MSLLANSNAIESGGYPIQRSLRFRSSASAYLNRTPSVTGNQKTWVWSGWIKRGALGAYSTLISAGSAAANADGFRFTNTDTLEFFTQNGTGCNLITTQVFRDPSAGYHIVLAYDSTQATAANRVKLYVNGSQVTSFSTATYPALNANSTINLSGIVHAQAVNYNSAYSLYLDGYLAEVNFIDGQALTPSSFGQTDPVTGVWTPKKYTGTYGTNGFYLPFSDNTSATTLAYDKSGNGNNWTANNISTTAGATYDSMTDVPTLTSATAANYCVLNPVSPMATGTISNGNLTYTTGTSQASCIGTFGVNSGKWYWEVTPTTSISAGAEVGIVDASYSASSLLVGNIAKGYAYYSLTGEKSNNGTNTAYGASYTIGDVIGVALDMDSGTVAFYKNGASQGTAFTGLSGSFCPASSDGSGVNGGTVLEHNFGQRPFSYTPPTGFKALNTFNLPDPTIKKPNQYMDATLYTGTGAAQTITNSGGFQPDLVWNKIRSLAGNHLLTDSVRGVTKQLSSSRTDAEQTETQAITSFNSNGFSLGTGSIAGYGTINDNGSTYVGWQWKKGATPGFDIVTYTGTGVARTVSHSLGVAPKMMIVKNRSGVYNWRVYSEPVGATKILYLNATDASVTDTAWNNTAPTSSVFSLGANSGVNANGDNFVNYLFAEIAGFSKFGSFSGNTSTDGPFIFTGFRPSYVMLKRTDAAGYDWFVFDAARNTYNVVTNLLKPNLSDAESSATYLDFCSNGFKIRATSSGVNTGTIIYACFASNPFKYALGV